MKKPFYLTLLLIMTSIINGQNAYIQVIGEPNLKVFLNNEFKAKTTADIGGCIIENVSPGKNLIKIIKEGFVPFEESITIKPKEVFAYKVKTFQKNTVYISEKGNTGETDKKATIATGKLIIQSVPINIKITIPSIEGVTNMPKTKDEWMVDKIGVGKVEIKFIFNDKVVSKTIEIIENETTSVFVNMINSDVKISNTKEDKLKGDAEFMKFTYFKYYDIGLTIEEAKAKYPDYFKKSDSYKYKDQPEFDRAYSSPISGLYLYGKNGKIVGCLGYFQGSVSDDSSFSKGNKAISDLVDNLTIRFAFSPKITNSTFNNSGFTYDTISYIWEKNNKSVSLLYTKKHSQNENFTDIRLGIFDN